MFLLQVEIFFQIYLAKYVRRKDGQLFHASLCAHNLSPNLAGVTHSPLLNACCILLGPQCLHKRFLGAHDDNMTSQSGLQAARQQHTGASLAMMRCRLGP
jgi:hypothetical protein